MKKLLAFVAVAALSLVSTGCISYNNNAQGGPYAPVCVKPVEVTPIVEIAEKPVETTVSASVLFGVFSWGYDSTYADRANLNGCGATNLGFGINETLKKVAIYKACALNKCDNLASCSYDIKTDSFVVFKTVTLTVKGYPVYQKGLKLEK